MPARSMHRLVNHSINNTNSPNNWSNQQDSLLLLLKMHYLHLFVLLLGVIQMLSNKDSIINLLIQQIPFWLTMVVISAIELARILLSHQYLEGMAWIVKITKITMIRTLILSAITTTLRIVLWKIFTMMHRDWLHLWRLEEVVGFLLLLDDSWNHVEFMRIIIIFKIN